MTGYYFLRITLSVNWMRTPCFVKNDSGTKHVYRMKYNGNSQEPFSPITGTTFNYPDVSHDGNKIVYTDGQNVFTNDLNDIGGVSQKQLLVPQQGRKANLRWASRHPVVGYANYENGKASIFLSATDASGANPHQVTYPSGSESDGGGHDFYVDNNVQNIVYSRDGDLYYMFYNGTQPPNRITNTPGTVMETLPVVSHDGQLLAYRVSFKLTHLICILNQKCITT